MIQQSADHAAKCRLCHTVGGHALFSKDKRRAFLRCPVCALVFVDDPYLLSLEAEKQRYDKHENVPTNEGYRKFLSRAVDALVKHLPPPGGRTRRRSTEKESDPRQDAAPLDQVAGASTCSNDEAAPIVGLDFGCGPGPALDALVREARPDSRVALYDIFYYPDETVLEDDSNKKEENGSSTATSGKQQGRGRAGNRGKYDFITMTEVIEHLHDVRRVLCRLWPLLKDDGGLLVIMTDRVISQDRFHNWHYKNDLTHVSFFSEATFQWLVAEGNDMLSCGPPSENDGRATGVRLHMEGADVVVLEKVLR